jgi:uncharacterized protein (TIGR02996 family)
VTEDALLFAAALAHPDEDVPRLALADWFDEHDEPALALALRDGRNLVAFLVELTRWDTLPVRPIRAYKDEAHRAMARLLARYPALFPVPPGARTEFSETAPYPMTSRDPLPPPWFLFQWQRERRKQIIAIRELAARDSDKSPSARPFRALPDARGFEEQSLFLHELVLRGRTPSRIAGALDHAAQMRARGHPLAWLPLALLAADAELLAYVPPVPRAADNPLGVGRVGAPAVVGSDVLELKSPVFAAVRGWAEESKSGLEGHVFRLDQPLDTDTAGSVWFAQLPVAAPQDPAPATWTVNRLTASGALAALFGTASADGAHGHREAGAYARLHAWQSLGALAGCAPDVPAEDVAAVVDRCEWFTFGGVPWFHRSFVLGLICVRPDRLSVALLAVTDKD